MKSGSKEISLSLILLLLSDAALSYGGGGSGGGGSSCTEPQFSSFSPKGDATLTRLDQISFEISKNTDLSTLRVEVDGVALTPELTPLRSGDTAAKLRLTAPKTEPARVRVVIRAKSDEGCEALVPSYFTVKP